MDNIPIREYIFRGSSAVEQSTVNRLVVGSIPTHGAYKRKGASKAGAFSFVKDYVNTVIEFRPTGGAIPTHGASKITL
jgi:hypothetical protein